jgi:hypothetical protein
MSRWHSRSSTVLPLLERWDKIQRAYSRHHFLQGISVGGEVLADLKRATKFDGGNHAVRSDIGVDEFGRCRASSCLVGEIHVRVVKKQP